MNSASQAEFASKKALKWSPSDGNFRLSKGTIHVWYASLNQTGSSLRLLERILSEDEQARAGALYGKRRKRFVASRGILREILGYYSHVSPAELRFSYSEQGKPNLTEEFGAHEVRFNLAHSHGFALYVISEAREVGVDLERIVRITELDKIVSRFLSNQERHTISQFSGHDKLVAFFQIWTRKEAYLKAQGKRLSHLSAEIQDSFGGSGWCIRGLTPAPGFVGAVASEGAIRHLDFWKWQT